MQQLRVVKAVFSNPLERLQRIKRPPKRMLIGHASHTLMIRPTFFNVNDEALKTNTFIYAMPPDANTIRERALEEHNNLIQALQEHSIPVHVFDGIDPLAVDALFCNNWITVHHPLETEFHTIVLYPMMLENRRIEVRNDICDYVSKMYEKTGAKVLTIDLRYKSSDNLPNHNVHFLEGTGSMVVDRKNRTIYASLSDRTHLMMLRELSTYTGHKLVFFHSYHKRKPIYHTNVMMALGDTWIVICKDVVAPGCQSSLTKELERTGKTIVEITTAQMEAYCANIIELTSASGKRYTVMSEKAKSSFTQDQLDVLGNIIAVPFDTIEKYGGGGVRCCIAEI